MTISRSPLLVRLGVVCCTAGGLLASQVTAHAQPQEEPRVSLPWSEARKVLVPPGAPQPLRDHAVRQNTLRLSWRAGRVLAEHHLEVETFRDWATVPLVPNGVAVQRGALDGLDAALIEHEGAIAAIVPSPGAHRLVVSYVVAERVGPGEVVAVPLVRRPTLTVEVERTSGGWTVEASPVLTAAEGAERAEIVGLLVPSTDRLEVRWVPPPLEPPPASERLSVTVRHRLWVDDEGIGGVAELWVEGPGEPPGGLTVEVPASLGEVRVRGDAVLSVSEAGPTRRRVELGTPRRGPTRVDVLYRLGGPEAGTFSVPLLGVVGAVAQPGTITLATAEGVKVIPPSLDGLLEAGGEGAGEVGTVTWRMPASGEGAPWTVRRHTRVELLESAVRRVDAETVVTPDDKSVTRMRLEVANNTRPFLRMRSPTAGLEIWSVFVDGQAVKPTRDAEGDLLIPLVRSAHDGAALVPYPVELTFFAPIESPSHFYGRMSLALPALDVVTADILWTVWLSDRTICFDYGGTLWPTVMARPTPPDALDGDANGEPATAGSLPRATPEAGVRLPARLEVPTTGTALRFSRPLAREGEPLRVDFRTYDLAYVRTAEVLALLGLFAAMLAFYAHLLLAITRGRVSRSRLWTPVALVGAATFALLQVFLPIPWPVWWVVALLVVGSGSLYGTVVFWTTIIGLAHELWARFGKPNTPTLTALRGAPEADVGESAEEDDA